MNKKSGTSKASATKLVKTIRRKTRQVGIDTPVFAHSTLA
jgi:hypothetical protein